jgi:hypothetical protein
MKRKSENVITYQLDSNEIKKALVAYINDNKTECGKLGFAATEGATLKMTLDKDAWPILAEISSTYKNEEEPDEDNEDDDIPF